jgi:hypothetical protein
MVDATQKVDILGLLFGVYNTAEGQEDPKTDLTIKKTDLNQSSGNFVGRFAWSNTGGYTETILAKVKIDGVEVPAFGGSRVTTQGQNGTVDTVVFRWPNTAKANKIGMHVVEVTPGVRHGVMGGDHTYGIGFPSSEWSPSKRFTVTLVE